MAEFKEKLYLDEAGLKLYDELIKEYIDKGASKDQEAIDEIIETLAGLSTSVSENTQAIEVLNGEGEGSVKKAVSDAITELVAGAPETLDTLKEIVDWIESDETGSAQLISKVSALEEADENLKDYVDEQDLILYNSIQSLETLKINALFPEIQKADESAAVAIATLEAGKALKLTANQEITDNLTINKACYIDANGSTFTGTVTIPTNADVVIENATFSNPVIVA